MYIVKPCVDIVHYSLHIPKSSSQPEPRRSYAGGFTSPRHSEAENLIESMARISDGPVR